MKNKAPLALMEQILMLLVFALAAALCLQVFVFSAELSRNCETQASAAAAVQNAAEITKACKGDAEQIRAYLGGTAEAEGLTLFYDSSWATSNAAAAAYTVSVMPDDPGLPALGGAVIRAADGENILFEVTVYWQEDIREER